jgi:hypothetical protein
MEHSILDLNREIVLSDYQSATVKNKELFITGDVNASSEYIFDNQKEDGRAICDKFYETNVRVISIVKRTKVGMDGLIIEVAKIWLRIPTTISHYTEIIYSLSRR